MNTSSFKSTEEILGAVESFPSLPQAVVEIIRSIDDDSMTPQLLTRKIESDLGMLAGVLKLANSSRYAVRGGVSSPQQAVTILGFNAIRNLACLDGLSSHFRENSHDDFNFGKFMRHSIGVACCAKFIARRIHLNPDIAFVAGLLHDVGQLVVAVTLPGELHAVMEYKKRQDCHISVAEHAVLGIDHAGIGAHLVDRWNFPSAIGEAIGGHHHVFDDVSSRMADTVHVAEVLSHALDFGGSGQVPPLSHGAMMRLELSFQQMQSHFGEIEDEYSDFAKVLGVD
ncbi:MAG: HDOD domain-containing protein [Gallionella sp.]|jgi:putative nucleotidyltransferase with HDIG domain|nr:HDOD domain-containing protein [Gallionella sp.]MCK9353630.1 HDOD domain-containing protein [Gallionella sp.]